MAFSDDIKAQIQVEADAIVACKAEICGVKNQVDQTLIDVNTAKVAIEQILVDMQAIKAEEEQQLIYILADKAATAQSLTDMQLLLVQAQELLETDITRPVITLNGLSPAVHPYGTPYTDPGATVTDNVDGDRTIFADAPLNVNVLGTQTQTYNTVDAANNFAIQAIRPVLVEDQEAPVITLPAGNTITLNEGDTFNPPMATVTDNVDPTRQIPGVGNVDTSVPGNYEIKYNTQDAAGNVADEVVLTVIVEVDTGGVPVLSISEVITSNVVANSDLTAYRVFGYTDQPIGTVVTVSIPGAVPETVDITITSAAFDTNLFDVSNINDGIDVIQITATQSNSYGTTSAILNRSKDIVPPVISLNSLPDIDSSNVAAYEISATVSGSKGDGNFYIYHPGGTNFANDLNVPIVGNLLTQTFDLTNLENGTVKFIVRTEDELGNIVFDEIIVNKAVAILPVITIDPALTLNANAASNLSAYPVHVTSDQADGSVVNITVSGAATEIKPATITAGVGSAKFGITGIADGSGALQISASQTVNSQTGTASLNRDKDVLAPVVTIDVLPNATATNASAYPISGTASIGDGNASITISGVPGTYVTAVNASGIWNIVADVSAVADGANAIVVNASQTDAAGNTGNAVTQQANKDTSVGTLKAFPEAYGAGSNASGGRGGSVHVITTLDPEGPGSVYDILKNLPDNSNVVSMVSGVVDFRDASDKEFSCTASNISVYGHTAPQGGLTIKGAAITFRGSNIIVRGIKGRLGFNPDYTGQGGDPLQVTAWSGPTTDVIFDHCEMSYSNDQNSNIYGYGADLERVTYQNCLLADPLYYSHAPVGLIISSAHSEDPITDVSLIGNLYANSSHRNPLIKSSGNYELINNVSFNHKFSATSLGGGCRVNMIGNTYIEGLDTIINREIMITPASEWAIEYPTSHVDKNREVNIYLNDNANDGGEPDWDLVKRNNAANDHSSDLHTTAERNAIEVSTPIALGMANPPTPMERATAEAYVLANAGATKRLLENGTFVIERDALETSVIAGITNGTGRVATATTRVDWTLLGGVKATTDINLDDWTFPAAVTHPQSYLDKINSYIGADNTTNYGHDALGYTAFEQWVNGIRNAPSVNSNIPADAITDTETATSEVATTFSPLGNDLGTSITITAITQPTNGTATFTESDIVYTSDNGYTGSDSMTYTITDADGGTDTATINITVEAIASFVSIEYVGGDSVYDIAGGDLSIDISGLTSSLQADDFAIAYPRAHQSNNTIAMVTAGWLPLANFPKFETGGTDHTEHFFYKVLDGTETLNDLTNSVANRWSTSIHVFRNVDVNNPFDVTPTYKVTVDSENEPNPAITTISEGCAMLLFHGFGRDDMSAVGLPSTPAGLVEADGSLFGPANDHAGQVLAYKLNVGPAGTYTPTSWTHTTDSTLAESSGTTMALRPKAAV